MRWFTSSTLSNSSFLSTSPTWSSLPTVSPATEEARSPEPMMIYAKTLNLGFPESRIIYFFHACSPQQPLIIPFFCLRPWLSPDLHQCAALFLPNSTGFFSSFFGLCKIGISGDSWGGRETRRAGAAPAQTYTPRFSGYITDTLTQRYTGAALKTRLQSYTEPTHEIDFYGKYCPSGNVCFYFSLVTCFRCVCLL